MDFRELLSMALGALSANKLRSALTLLGMVIGVFAIIVSVTAVEVIASSVTNTFESFGATTFQVERTWDMQVAGGRRSFQAAPNLTYEQAERLRERAQLPAGISPAVSEWAVRYRSPAVSTEQSKQLIGSNEDWTANNAYTLAEGRSITADDVRFARPVAVLGADLADELFPNETALGKDVSVDRGRVRVVGVFAEKGSTMGGNQDDLALVPITTLFQMYGRPNRDIDIDVRAASMQAMQQTQDEVIGALRVIRGVRPGEDNNFRIESSQDDMAEFQGVSNGVTLGGVGIGLLTLLAAGIGIMNIMLVTVAERTREIGLRKSLGAKRRDVLRQFLVEAVILCQIGGVIGVVAGILVGNSVAIFFDMPFAVPWVWVAVAVLGVTFFALTFGVYPAWKAARLDPIEALRRE
jgi:putative ABC transport system permease protein